MIKLVKLLLDEEDRLYKPNKKQVKATPFGRPFVVNDENYMKIFSESSPRQKPELQEFQVVSLAYPDLGLKEDRETEAFFARLPRVLGYITGKDCSPQESIHRTQCDHCGMHHIAYMSCNGIPVQFYKFE